MLVLGRPGSGCTSFLKTVANKRSSFKRIEGDVFYGNMTAKEAEKYRGLVLYNSEEDMHLPTLTVAETLGFAVKNRVSRHVRQKGAKEHVDEMLDVVPEALGISHAKETLVGNEFVRGVSGGERKRVSIGEVMAAQGSITCWDNATRGLTHLPPSNTRRHAEYWPTKPMQRCWYPYTRLEMVYLTSLIKSSCWTRDGRFITVLPTGPNRISKLWVSFALQAPTSQIS